MLAKRQKFSALKFKSRRIGHAITTIQHFSEMVDIAYGLVNNDINLSNERYQDMVQQFTNRYNLWMQEYTVIYDKKYDRTVKTYKKQRDDIIKDFWKSNQKRAQATRRTLNGPVELSFQNIFRDELAQAHVEYREMVDARR